MLRSSALPPLPSTALAHLAVCGATAVLVFGFASLEHSPAAALETNWLGATVVLSLVLAATFGGRWLAPGAVLLGTVLIALPPGASRATAVLALALALVIAEGVQALKLERPAWIDRFAVLAPLALAAQFALRGAALFEEGVAGGSWLLPTARLLGLPLVAAAALAFLPDPRRAATAAAAVVSFGPGWNLMTTLLALPIAWAVSLLPRRILRPVQGGVLVLFFLCAVAAGYPWLVAEPWFAWFGAQFGAQPAWVIALALAGAALALPARRGWLQALLAGIAVVVAIACLPARRTVVSLPPDASLTAERPRIRLAVPDLEVARLVLSTTLSNAVELPSGTEVARLEWLSPAAGGDGDEVIFQASLEAGRDSAEWAARRPDVRAFLGDTASWPASAFHWLAEGEDGPFFGTVYQTAMAPPEPLPGGNDAALRLIRSPELPPEVLVRIHRIEVAP